MPPCTGGSGIDTGKCIIHVKVSESTEAPGGLVKAYVIYLGDILDEAR